MRMLKFFGIRTIYISQQVDSDNGQAETLLTVHGLVDGLYLQEMAKKIKRGLRGQQERGYSTGAKTYGYSSVPVVDPSGKCDADGPIIIGKKVEIDPEQATIIRQIFHWYVEGMSHPTMADRLTTMAVRPPRGTRWSRHQLQRILTNERYLGKAIWGQQVFERRPGTNRRVARRQPRELWHVADRPDLRIIDDDLWERAQARRTTVKRSLQITSGSNLARGKTGLYSTHLMVGLSRCGICGRAFTVTSSGHGSPRYGCPNSWANGTTACDNRLTIRAKVADPVILERLQDELLRPAMVEMITTAVTTEVKNALRQRPSARKRLEARCDTVMTKLANLVEAIESGVSIPSVKMQVATRQAELEEIARAGHTRACPGC